MTGPPERGKENPRFSPLWVYATSGHEQGPTNGQEGTHASSTYVTSHSHRIGDGDVFRTRVPQRGDGPQPEGDCHPTAERHQVGPQQRRGGGDAGRRSRQAWPLRRAAEMAPAQQQPPPLPYERSVHHCAVGYMV